MKLLLDTHIFLWYISGDSRLAASTIGLIHDPANQIILSVAFLWEIIIKYQIGKLPLPHAPETCIPRQRELHGIISASIDEASVVALGALPSLHRDPFDRILIAQAIQSGLTIITVDDAVRAYAVPTI